MRVRDSGTLLLTLLLAAAGCGGKSEDEPTPVVAVSIPSLPAEKATAPAKESLELRLAAIKIPEIDMASAGDDEILREFLGIARTHLTGDHPYNGYAVIAPLVEKWIGREQLDARERHNLDMNLTFNLLRIGEVDMAVEVISQSTEWVKGGDFPAAALIATLRMQGVAYLRQAEVANCIRRHNRECCIFPLAGGGVHTAAGPAANARDVFRECIGVAGPVPSLVWLYNISCMALGEYPEKVEKELLIPPTAFASAGEVKRFPDIATQLGIDAFNCAGASIAEDFDGDGLIDLVTTSLDPTIHTIFYKNDGKGGFIDRSKESGLASQFGGLNGVAADYDNDGDADLLILRGAWARENGRIRNSLLNNDGKGRFTDVTRAAGLAVPAMPTQAAAWGDFDNDGDLDLYIGNESLIETEPSAAKNPAQLFWNQGNGKFVDGAIAAGVTNDRFSKGVAVGDFDNDGWLDIYVSNSLKNRLYRNKHDGTFEDVAEALAVTQPETMSFATWFFDYDNDGWLDLWVGGYQAELDDIAAYHMGLPHSGTLPRLYRNTGGAFVDMTRELGLDRPSMPMGANFGDLEFDGWLDFYLATGNPDYETIVPNLMFKNDGGARFLDVTSDGGFGHLQKGHGVSWADFDEDGDQDLHVQLGGAYPGDAFSNVFFQNPGGHGHHFLKVKLDGTKSPRNGYGTRVEVIVETPDGLRSIHRAPGAVSSFGGNPSRLEIGLGNATRIVCVKVRWPIDGHVQTVDSPALDSQITIME